MTRDGRMGTAAATWLCAFEEAPTVALAAFVEERAFLGRDEPFGRAELLLDWSVARPLSPGLAERLDTSAAEWVETNWLRYPSTKNDWRTFSSAWITIATLPASASAFTLTAAAFRSRFDEIDYLRNFVESPSKDPVGRYLTALARHQGSSRILAPIWWQILELAPSVPHYHASIGLAGLLGLPTADPADDGDIPLDVMIGVFTLARALDLQVNAQILSREAATSEWRALAQLAFRRLNFPDRWQDARNHFSRQLPEFAETWLANRTPKTHKTYWPTPDFAGWQQRAEQILRLFREERTVVIATKQAKQLLDEERRYAERSGVYEPLVLSLTRFARATRTGQDARIWSGEAIRVAPADPLAWLARVQADLEFNDVTPSLDLALEAAERFPENVFLASALGTGLRRAGRLVEAEETFRRAIELTRGDAHLFQGLGLVLSEAGRANEAEALLRDAVDHFDSPVLWDELGLVLMREQRLAEAKETFAVGVERFPSDKYLRAHLTALEKGEPLPGEPKWRDPATQSTRASIRQARLLRNAARRAQEVGADANAARDTALGLLATLNGSHGGTVNAERILLHVERGDGHVARDLVQSELDRSIGNLTVLYAAVRTAREYPMLSNGTSGLLTRMEQIHPGSYPVVALERARLAAADDAADASHAVERLRALVSAPPESSAFDRWWWGCVRETLAPETPDASQASGLALSSKRILDVLEENLLHRIAS